MAMRHRGLPRELRRACCLAARWVFHGL